MENATSLQLGITAFKAGEKDKARFHLLKAVREEPNNEQGWGWLSNTAETEEERIHCLRQVLRINPQNTTVKKMVEEFDKNEWIRTPPINNSRDVAVQTSQPTQTAPAMLGSDTIPTIIVALLVVMILYWLGIGFLQYSYALINSSNAFDLFCWGTWNIGISIVNATVIPLVLSRKKKVIQQLYFLAILGSVFGIFQMALNASLIQVCAIPLYIMLGILAYISKELFVN